MKSLNFDSQYVQENFHMAIFSIVVISLVVNKNAPSLDGFRSAINTNNYNYSYKCPFQSIISKLQRN